MQAHTTRPFIFQGQCPLLDAAIRNIDTSHQVLNINALLFKNKVALSKLSQHHQQHKYVLGSSSSGYLLSLPSQPNHHQADPLSFSSFSSYSSAGPQGFTSEPEQYPRQALLLPSLVQLQKSSTSSSHHDLLLLFTKSNLNSLFGQQDCSSDFIS